jgi:hypothetical protein
MSGDLAAGVVFGLRPSPHGAVALHTLGVGTREKKPEALGSGHPCGWEDWGI